MGQGDGAAETGTKESDFAQLRGEGSNNLDLADDLGKTATGDIDLFVFLGFNLLPASRRQRGEQGVDRENDNQQHGQRPVVPSSDGQHCTDGQQHREEVVGKRLEELRDIGNRAFQAGNNCASDLAVEIALRQRQQLCIVTGRQNLAHARSHHIAQVTTDVMHDGLRQIGNQQSDDQPNHGASGIGHRRLAQAFIAGHRADDGVGGIADEEGANQRRGGGGQRTDDDPDIERPEHSRGG